MRGVLGELTPRAMWLLEQLEPRGWWGRRARICRALHELGDEASPGSSPALAVRVHDSDRRTRDAAAWAFGRVASARPAACALALEASDEDYGGRGAARPEFGAASEVGGLMALTLSTNGYLRESALRRLAELGRPEPLAFVLVRSNDWVPQVRRAALAAARAVLSPRFARAWVLAWPVIEHLEHCGRVDRSDLDELVEDARRMLAAAWNGGAVEEGMRAADPLVRRAAWRLALEFAPADTSGELLLDALAAGDLVVARRAAALAGRVADPRMRAELLARRLAHHDPNVRRRALHDHPVDGLVRALEPRLLDRHGGVRTAAAYLWRKRLDRDPAAYYRDRLTATDPKALERALRGLAAEGSASDAARAAPWLEAAAPRLRAAAFDLAARAEDPLPVLRRALVDPSRHVRDVARRRLRNDRDRLDADLLPPALEPHRSMTSNLILASTSRYRRALLERLGVPFTCIAPGVDEDAFKAAGLEPNELARVLAREKAAAVARRHPEAVVIGSDQVCALGDEVLDKPGTREVAIERLARLAGHTHRLVTAVCVARGEEYDEFSDVTRLTMRPVTPAQIERYVDADEPFDCAGGYKLETRGIALFERIDSADQTAIVGLPLMALVGALSKLGFELP